MISKVVKALLAAALLSWPIGEPVQACVDNPDFYCGLECDSVPGRRGLYCLTPSQPDRSCIDSGSGNVCAETYPDQSCAPCGGEGGF